MKAGWHTTDFDESEVALPMEVRGGAFLPVSVATRQDEVKSPTPTWRPSG